MSRQKCNVKASLLFTIVVVVAVAAKQTAKTGSSPFQRDKRSLKQTASKVDSLKLNTPTLREKVSKVENDIGHGNGQINHKFVVLERSFAHLQDQFDSQNDILSGIESELVELHEVLESQNGTKKEPVPTRAPSSEKYFEVSNNTCGQLMTSDAGYIIYNPNMHSTNQSNSNAHAPKYCVWTIQAGYKDHVKILTRSFNEPRVAVNERKNDWRPYVIQLSTPSPKDGNRSAEFQTTFLLTGHFQVFSGPVVWVVFPVVEGIESNFQLEYESLGKKSLGKIHFTHVTLQPCCEHQCETIDTSVIAPARPTLVGTFKTDYIAIVSNFSTKVFYEIEDFDKSQCKSEDKFLIYGDASNNDGIEKDRCKVDHAGAFVAFDKPVLIVITKNLEYAFNFRIPMRVEQQYSSNYSYTPGASSCGGIVGGTSGVINYKVQEQYENNERCIWVISPQPIPSQSIDVKLVHTGVEDYFDILYLMELTDVNGTLLPDGPKITNLATPDIWITVHSREVYIVFYTDNEDTGTGFRLEYKSRYNEHHDSNHSTIGIFNQYESYQTDKGTALVDLDTKYRKRQIIMLNPPFRTDGYENNLQIQLRGANNVEVCGTNMENNFYVFTTHDGVFGISSLFCNNSSPVTAHATDGLAIVVINNESNMINSSAQIAWKMEAQELGAINTSKVNTNVNQCGGVIEADSGKIRYMTSDETDRDEKCIWTILSSKSRLNVKLRNDNDELNSCCDFILAGTVNPESGRMSTFMTEISRFKPTATIEIPAIIIFSSNHTQKEIGFILDFNATGTQISDQYKFTAIHSSASGGSFTSSPDTSSGDKTHKKKITIYTYNEAKGYTLASNLRPYLVGNFLYGMFQRDYETDGTCVYESMTAYTFLPYTYFNSKIVNEYVSLNSSTSSQCPQILPAEGIPFWFQTTYYAFIVIHEGFSPGGLATFNWKRGNLCGESFIGEVGTISYKEHTNYNLTEECIWTVKVPGASKIQFTLEKEEFENCCDYIMLASINPITGVPGNVTTLGYQMDESAPVTRWAVVDGPVVIVTFKSDDSVEGRGFLLRFSNAGDTTNHTLPYKYVVGDKNILTWSNQSFLIGQDEMFISTFSPDLNRLNEYYDKGIHNLKVEINTLRPQVNLYCDSDQLTIYKFPDVINGFQEQKRYQASDILQLETNQNGQCSAIRDGQLSKCANDTLRNCEDKPQNNQFYSQSKTFLLIYKSAPGTPNDLSLRGFTLNIDQDYSLTKNTTINESSSSTIKEVTLIEGDPYSFTYKLLHVTLDTRKNCCNFSSDWFNRVTGVVSPTDICYEVWSEKFCKGQSQELRKANNAYGHISIPSYSSLYKNSQSIRIIKC